MEMIKKFKALLVIPLIGIAGVFFFFYLMGSNDDLVLANFLAAYKKFDQAISDYSTPLLTSNLAGAPAAGDLKEKADQALVELNTKASARISSLTRNDGDLMKIMLEIANLSGKEVDTLKAYQSAVAARNVDANQLAKQFRDLTLQRQTDYARFLELAGR